MKYTKSKKRVYKKKFNYKNKKNLKKTINKIVLRKMETKQNDVEVQTKVIYGYLDGTTFSALIPTINQGVDQGARIGNKISCVNLKLRMSIYCLPYSNTVAPVYFDLYIYKLKRKAQNPPSNSDFSRFLQDGNNATAYVGNVLDGLRVMNSDLFTQKLHRRYLMVNYNGLSIAQTSSINPCKSIIINLTKYIKKVWMFDDAVSTISNDTLFMSIACTLTDGSVLPLSTQFGTYSFFVEASYKDA